MEIINSKMRIVGNNVYLSRYEIVEAFFRTEEENNLDMANALNQMINMFCEAERKTKRNVLELPFDINTHKQTIDYIEKTAIC